MKSNILFYLLLLLSLTACTNQTSNSHTVKDSTKLISLQKENDSLKSIISDKENIDSLVIENRKDLRKGGIHPISLHWISWDKPGYATVEPINDGWYTIKGKQENKDGDYLTIDGKIRRISEKELEFDGTIVTKHQTNNHNKPCLKEGKQTFFAKGDRTYFRLQNMINCEGGMLVDYVDIFPGKSTL